MFKRKKKDDESKETPRLKPLEFRIGHPDNSGEKVIFIYAANEIYVVYRTKTSVAIDFDDVLDADNTYWNRDNAIMPEKSRVFSYLPRSLNSVETINKQIAKALTFNLEGNAEGAKRMLKEAESRTKRLRKIQGRVTYALSSMLSAGLVILVALGLRSITDDAIMDEIYLVIICGMLGGLLSVSLGFMRIDIDLDANAPLNCLVGASRIIIAGVASIVAWFMIKANLAFGAIVHDNAIESTYGLGAVAVMSGFSEYLIPNILRRIGKDEREDATPSNEIPQQTNEAPKPSA